VTLLRYFSICGFILLSVAAFAQETIVKGKVVDANSGDPLPFVNVVFIGTAIGATTDFDGNYIIKTNTPGDTVVASYVGYISRKKQIQKGQTQTVNFTLQEDVTSLAEVVVKSGENPAWEILRQVVKNKTRNDKRQYNAYEYDTYTKIEIDVDNMSDKMRKKKVMKKITQVLDSVDRIAGEDGKPILPLFISESVSKFYYREDPTLKYEHILKSKMTGVGIDDGTFVTQLVGTSFQEYNFYQNWLNILGKEFVSPIADGWRLYYDYDLMDSVYVGDDFCYRLDVYPKSAQELAFTGTIWITKEDYALKQVDATISKEANLNFIEKIKIQQELSEINQQGWLPVKNRVLIDISEISNRSAGMLAKFYTSNKNFVINKPREVKFYQKPIVMAEDARLYEAEEYWDTLRHEPLSSTEKSVYKMIDTLTNMPVVRTYTDIIKTAVNGYFDAGKIYIGPYNALIAVNNIEGLRLMAGLKTTIDFSNKWILRGQFGYGFNDERFKYLGRVDHIFSRKHWTIASIRIRSDIGRVGIDEDAIADSYLLAASQRWGNFRRGYYFDEGRFNIQRELFKGFTGRVAARYMTFRPTFPFEYKSDPEGMNTAVASNFETAEVTLEARYARDEVFLQDDNERVSMGTTKSPIFTLRYTRGLEGVAGSDFDYTKVKLSVNKRIKWGPLGYSYFNLAGEYIFDPVPYPLLSPHLGNQSFFYTTVTYNLMDYGEFVSDRYLSLNYQHHFEGLFLNRIPLIQKLKWRLVGTANILYGGLTEQNREMILIPSGEGNNEFVPAYFQKGKPYLELGYGVENIFRFLRIDFVHRLSYLDYANEISGVRPDVRNFAILFSAQFSL
jgi:hypothetical protein